MLQTFKQVVAYFNERDKIGIKPGLERVFNLLEKANHPEQDINGIHFAGTNGKGSTIEMVQSALVAHGYQVGVFTSPSFIGIRGHFLINGIPVEKEKMIQLVNELMPHIDALDAKEQHPTTFEILTVIAFMYFKDNTDIVLVETGMGGRYDTTNCFIPLISVITTIAYDHMEFLGSSIEEIASQKAGIIKKKRPLVLGNVSEAARDVILKEASEKSASTYVYKETFNVDEGVIRIDGKEQRINIHELALKGQHQMENAAVAMMTLSILDTLDFPLEWGKIEQAIKTTTLPGRFEKIYNEPIIILDSAHNIAGIQALKKTIGEMHSLGKTELLFAGFYDKQLSEMLPIIHPLFDKVVLTTFEHERAATRSMLETLEHDLYVPHWQDYVEEILHQKSNTTYFITGSLHFITLVRAYLLAKKPTS